MHILIVVPAPPPGPGQGGSVPVTVPGAYEHIVPRYPRKYPGQIGDVHRCSAAMVKVPKDTRYVT